MFKNENLTMAGGLLYDAKLPGGILYDNHLAGGILYDVNQAGSDVFMRNVMSGWDQRVLDLIDGTLSSNFSVLGSNPWYWEMYRKDEERKDGDSAAVLIGSVVNDTANVVNSFSGALDKASTTYGVVGIDRDSMVENVMEKAIGAYDPTGFLGAIVVGSIGSYAVTGKANLRDNVVEHVTDRVTSTMTNVVTQSIMQRMAITSVPGMIIVNMVVGAFVTELAEIATGKDNHFGFGGQLVGHDAYGQPVFSAPMGFVEGLFAATLEALSFGMLDTALDANIKSAQERINASYLTQMEYGIPAAKVSELGSMRTIEQSMIEQDLLTERGLTYGVDATGMQALDRMAGMFGYDDMDKLGIDNLLGLTLDQYGIMAFHETKVAIERMEEEAIAKAARGDAGTDGVNAGGVDSNGQTTDSSHAGAGLDQNDEGAFL